MKNFTLIIGNKNYSSWSLRPWILMKYFDIPFDEIVIPLYQSDSRMKLLSHSPAGKVPILKQDLMVVWDSLAIAEYLAELFPKKNLWPKDQIDRAWARSISAEMHSGFQALRTNCPMDIREENKEPKSKSAELEKDIARIQQIWQECRQRFENHGDFLFGDFSIADAMFAPVIFRCKTYKIKFNDEAKKYYETMLALPSMQEWKQDALKETWVINF